MTPIPISSAPPPGSGQGDTLAAALHAVLPQTQCTRCGYPDCAGYAQAMAAGRAEINQCPPGGDEGVERLARLTGRAVVALNPDHGGEAPRQLAVIDEDWCIGCTLCIKACPVDAILGGPKAMHTVIESECTGCELCIPVCPVDCIQLENASGSRTGWAAWSAGQARRSLDRYALHQSRAQRESTENEARLAAKATQKLADLAAHSRITEPGQLDAKRAVIEAALARARAAREKPAE